MTLLSSKSGIIKIFIITAALCLSLPISAIQQDIPAKVKAAFVYNFIKYIEWPNEKNIVNFNIGFYGTNEKYNEALQQIHGEKIKNFTINVIRLSTLEQEKKLHLIILDKSQSKNIKQVAKQFDGHATLIVSDNAIDKKYTMLNLIEAKQKKLSFELNRYQILNANLKASTDILVLGGTELDIASVLKEMDNTIKVNLDELKQQSNRLKLLKSNITKKEKKQVILQSTLRSQQKKLMTQSTLLDKQNIDLMRNKKDFQSLQGNFSKINYDLNSSQIKLSLNIKNLDTLKDNIQNKELTISSLEHQIDKRISALKNLENQSVIQEQKLEKQSNVIQKQYIILIFSAVIGFAILLILFVIYRSRKIQRNINQKLTINLEALADANEKLSNAQNQLVESEKMAALGGLVAGVAHEINTPIGVSVTASSHLADQIEIFEKEYNTGKLKKSSLENLLFNAKESTEILMRNLARASDLISNFKRVSVDQSRENKQKFDLKEYIEGIIQSLRPQFKKEGHSIVVHSDKNIILNSFPGVIAQIITNLIMNSVQHGFKDRVNGGVSIALSIKNSEVFISFRDNGIGLTTEQQKKVFEPFYTTARSSGGSGLGMSISYNLVTSKLDGMISCLNPDEGAHFEIVFPI